MIVADTFLTKFSPVSKETPRVREFNAQALFPVCNVPNLHYVIEFLVTNEIRNIYVAAKLEHRKALVDAVKGMKKHHH